MLHSTVSILYHSWKYHNTNLCINFVFCFFFPFSQPSPVPGGCNFSHYFKERVFTESSLLPETQVPKKSSSSRNRPVFSWTVGYGPRGEDARRERLPGSLPVFFAFETLVAFLTRSRRCGRGRFSAPFMRSSGFRPRGLTPPRYEQRSPLHFLQEVHVVCIFFFFSSGGEAVSPPPAPFPVVAYPRLFLWPVSLRDASACSLASAYFRRAASVRRRGSRGPRLRNRALLGGKLFCFRNGYCRGGGRVVWLSPWRCSFARPSPRVRGDVWSLRFLKIYAIQSIRLNVSLEPFWG